MQCSCFGALIFWKALLIYLSIVSLTYIDISYAYHKPKAMNVRSVSHRKTRDNRTHSGNDSNLILNHTKNLLVVVSDRKNKSRGAAGRHHFNSQKIFPNRKRRDFNFKNNFQMKSLNTQPLNATRGKRKIDVLLENSLLGLHNQNADIASRMSNTGDSKVLQNFNPPQNFPQPLQPSENVVRNNIPTGQLSDQVRNNIPTGQLSDHLPGHSFLRQRLLNALARRMQERNMIMHNPELIGDRSMVDGSSPLFPHEQQMLLDQAPQLPENSPQSSSHFPLPGFPMDHLMSNNQLLSGNLDGTHVGDIDGRQSNSFSASSEASHFPEPDDNSRYLDSSRREHFQDLSDREHFPDIPEAGRFSEIPEAGRFPEISDRGRFPEISERRKFPEVSERRHFQDFTLPARRMYSPTIGNLGDETLPTIGSLGDSKPEYIPLGRLQGEDTVANMFPPSNQMVGGDEITDFIPNERPIRHHKHHKGKKAWITDVNIYSKKKTDDINELLSSDDDDPNDEIDPCDPSPCHHAGICKIIGSIDHMCVCPRTYKGKNCEIRNRCHPNPCKNGGKCSETVNGFKCSCNVGYKGVRCHERNYCLPNPCQNAGVCTESPLGDHFSCACVGDYTGKTCEDQHSMCQPNPCQNHGHCVSDGVASFSCICHKGTTGKLCQEGQLVTDNSLESIASIFHVGEHTENAEEKSVITHPQTSTALSNYICNTTPCLNGGSCHPDATTQRGYICECSDTHVGANCEEQKCKCENGGSCIGEGVEVKCICKPGYAGSTCQEHTQCNEDTCMHGGICIEQVGGFRCKCDKGYKGQRCEDFDKCSPNPCLHGGQCKDYGDFYKCQCKRGFKGRQCEDVDFCEPNPCQNDAQCFGYVGGFQCECRSGYTGKLCDQKLHCLSNPCTNGAECIEVLPTPERPESSYKCGCKQGFTGDICDTKDLCHSYPCMNGGTCTNSKDDFICSCSDKFRGKQCDSINHCFDNPCKNNGKCTSLMHDFKCDCAVGFKGLMCDEIDYCQPNPCKNSGICSSNPAGNGFVCKCSEGYKGVNCEEVDPCFPNPCVHGQCSDVAGGYLCNCTMGFKGPQCSDIDHCNPNPCFHGGNCVEIKGGIGYLCNCPEGYKGQMCEEKDFCHPNPCQHNGVCKEISDRTSDNRFRSMYSNETEVIECNCDKGYRGKHCEELDQCFPNPCLHDSLCITEGKTGTKCNCSLGWKGEHCELADLCAPDPCRYGTHCIQTDAESYQCVKNLCTPNPCGNGGKCIVVNDESFECACPRGWRGKKCLEQDACVPNPCLNSGICHDTDSGGYKCECPKNFSGVKCDVQQKRRDEVANICSTSPCKNGGSCLLTSQDGSAFTCRCLNGYSGPLCDDNVCNPMPCLNGGTCVPYYGIALCKCVHGYTGAHCSDMKRTLSAINSFLLRHNVVDETGTEKSFTPHPSDDASKKANTLALAERVEEILNSDRDIKNSESDDLIQDITSKITPNTKANDILPPPPASHGRIDQYKNNPTKSVENPDALFNKPQADMLTANRQPVDYVKPAPPVPFPADDISLHFPAGDVSSLPQHNTLPSKDFVRKDSPLLQFHQPSIQSGDTPISSNVPSSLSNAPPSPGNIPPSASNIPPALPNIHLAKHMNQPIDAPQLTPKTTPQTKPIENFLLQNQKADNVNGIANHPPASTGDPSNELQQHPPPVIPASDPCVPNICSHDGFCVVRSNGDPECICKDGYSGPRCEYIGLIGYSSAPKFFPKDECDHCDVNAICINGHCICDGKYVGDGLECWLSTAFDKDWTCLVNPCQNGGTCKPGRAKCVCKLGYIGTYCETYCPPAVHLSFEGVSNHLAPQMIIKDESGNNNFASMTNGAFIEPKGGKCDAAVSLNGGDVLFDGESFYPKPYQSVTIAVWVKLDTNRGIQSIFDTVGGDRSSHREGQYHLEIDNGRVRWFHRNEAHIRIFSILTEPLVTPGNWTHITGTYNGVLGVAKLFINGDMAGIDSNTSSAMYLSQDWQGKAGIGKHQHTFGNRLLRGMVDEFYIFACPLPRLEILVLMHHCKIYWKNNKVKQKSTAVNKPVNHQQSMTKIAPVSLPVTLSSSSNFLKPKDHYQNYYGFNSFAPKEIKTKLEKVYNSPHPNKPQQNLLTVSGMQRQKIIVSGIQRQKIENFPNEPMQAKSQYFNSPDSTNRGAHPRLTGPYATQQNAPFIAVESQTNAPFMSLKPDGPSAFFTESYPGVDVNSIKRTNIIPINEPKLPLKHNALQDNNALESKTLVSETDAAEKYFNIPGANAHRAVQVLGPSEFLNQVIPQKSYPPVAHFIKGKNSHQGGDPRWFTWQKGLAQVNGGTYTNTHSNTLQRNDPGTANADTHVQSSQNSKGGTNIKQRGALGVPQSKLLFIQEGQRNPPPLNAGTRRDSPQANQRMQTLNAMKSQQQFVPPQQFLTRNVHTTTHTHQWGFGNGNGNGQGVGTPSASGSGGGWGAGGPLNQQASLPGWGGNPPDGPPWGNPQEQQQPQQQQRKSVNTAPHLQAPHLQAPVDPHAQLRPSKFQQSRPVIRNLDQKLPSNARSVWNAYIAAAAQKKQSNSDMHVDATNIAESSVKINPQNGGQNMQVAGHNWGFGNGNGEGHGQGSPGGQGQGGGWGAGGPTMQNTWFPGQQQRRVIGTNKPLHFRDSESNFMIVQAKRNQIPNYSFPPIINQQIPNYALTPITDQQVQAEFSANRIRDNSPPSLRNYAPLNFPPMQQRVYHTQYEQQQIPPMYRHVIRQQQGFNNLPSEFNMNPRKTFFNTELRALSDAHAAATAVRGARYDKKKRRKRKRRSVNR